MNIFGYILLCSLVASAAAMHTPEEWKSRTIYQVLTDRFARNSTMHTPCDLNRYCGGTYRGIVEHLDYIQDLGANAIWISPIVENFDEEQYDGYHGYWAKNLYAMNKHFGDADDLRHLIDECHKRDIWVMVDVVANHVGGPADDHSGVYPFNQTEHYHNCTGCPADCNIADWGNQYEVEHCRLSGLPDLNHENEFVYMTLLSWIREMRTVFDIDGFRVDTIPEVPKRFWRDFNNAAGGYCVGEAYNGNIDYVSGYQGPLDGVLSYPLYFTLKDVFMYRQSLYKLESMLAQQKEKFKDPSLLGAFIDNHDQQRWLNQNGDYELYKNALAYNLIADGIPIIYYGTEQGFDGGSDPKNREPLWESAYDKSHELYQYIRTVTSVRNTYAVWKYEQVQRYADDSFYAFTRGDVFVALTNVGGRGATVRRTITYHPYADGTTLCNVFWGGDCITVEDGKFTVVLTHGEAKIFIPQ